MKLHRFAILALALVVSTLSVAATNNASFKGTYTLAVASMYRYSPEYNNKGQQVGFCTGQKIPNGYSCGAEVEQDVISALIQQGASRRAAAKAAADAKLKAPEEFEPLFKAAVGLLH